MGTDYGREARKQYLKYFCVWFIVIGVLVLVLAVAAGIRAAANSAPRGNTQAPTERVFDYADVLTDEEEERLRSQIARMENRLRMDIVIVTISQPVEGREAAETYGYDSIYWEDNMEALADDFWDEKGFGYNKDFEGDGVLLLHNWYEDANGSQNGEHMSTSGKAEWELGIDDMDDILYSSVDRYYASNPYRAYSEFVDALVPYLGSGLVLPWFLVFFAPVVAALIYAWMNLRQEKAKDTTTINTYLAEGKPVLNSQRDEFIRKSVVTRHIQRSNEGGGSHHSSGGGHHHSSSGASHGGHSHRH